MGYKVAVVGATGNVGREMLNILDERKFPADEVVALASRRSIGRRGLVWRPDAQGQGARALRFLRRRHLPDVGGRRGVEGMVAEDRAAGAVVIDNSSAWRMDPDVPLIVPEVNADAVAGFRKKNIIANPNCSTAQLVVALKPLHDKATIKRVVVATYQSVSGAGKDAMDELFSQTKAVYTNERADQQEIPQAHRLQRDPADRRVHGGRLHQGRVEDDDGDQEDSRSQDQAHRHLRARAGVRRPFGGRQHRVRESDHAPTRRATSCATRRAAS
mgnify:CR=1 FL=1